MLEDRYKTYEPGIKKQVVEMLYFEIAINGSGIRDTSKILSINKKKMAWLKLTPISSK